MTPPSPPPHSTPCCPSQPRGIRLFSLYDWPRDPLLLSALRASVMETVGHTFSFHSLDRRGVSRIRASEESGTWPISNRGKIGPRGAGRIEGEKIFGDPTLDSTIDKTPRFPLSLFAFASKTHSVLFASSLPSRFAPIRTVSLSLVLKSQILQIPTHRIPLPLS